MQEYVEGLISQRSYPEQAYKQVLGLLALGKDYTSKRLNTACSLAMSRPSYSYGMIKSILENDRDLYLEPGLAIPEIVIPQHDNIRGPDHFG